MFRKSVLIRAVLGAALTASVLVSGARAENTSLKSQLTGSWVSVEIGMIAADGTKRSTWDTTPRGIMVFDSHGHVTQTLVRSDWMITFYGTYAVGDDNSLTYHVEGISYPNVNMATKRVAEIADDQLKITSAGSVPGVSGFQIWKRLK